MVMHSVADILSGIRWRAAVLTAAAGLTLQPAGRLSAATVLKADNTATLNSTASWLGGVVPGPGDTMVLVNTPAVGNGPLLTGSGSAGGNLEALGLQVQSGDGVGPGLALGTVNEGPAGTAGSLTLGRDGIDLTAAAGDLTVGNLTVELNSATGTESWDVAAGRTLTVSANLFGSGQGLTLDGAGRVVLGRAVTALSNCATDRASTTVTVPSVAGLFVGETVAARGGLIPPGTTVASLDATNETVVLSAFPTATAASTTLTFAASSLFDGGVTLNAGTLVLAGPGALGRGVLTISGGALDAIIPLTTGNCQSWNGSFAVDGSAGLIVAAPGVVTLGLSPAIMVNAGTFTVGAAIVDNGAGLGLTKLGANGTLVLTGENFYTGNTTINAGTVSIVVWNRSTENNSLGQAGPAASSLVLDGGALRFTGATGGSSDHLFAVGGGNATLDAAGSARFDFCNPGAIGFVGTPAPAYNLTLSGNGSGGGSLGVALVDNGTGALSVTKNGSGTWTVAPAAGQNTYTGGTFINSGVLIATGNGGTGPLGAGGSAVVLNGGLLQAGAIRLDNIITGDGGSIQAVGGDLEIGNRTVPVGVSFGGALVAGGRQVTVDSGGPASFGHIQLAEGGGLVSANGISLQGTGTLTAAGNATVGGPFMIPAVFSGRFTNGDPVGGAPIFIGASVQGPAGAAHLAFAGPLSGGGELNGNIMLLSVYTPGSCTPALIQVNGRTGFGSGSTLALQISAGDGRGLGYDSFDVNAGATLDVTNATLRLTLGNGFAPSAGNTFTLFKVVPGGTFTGTFFAIDTAAASLAPGLAWDLSTLYSAGVIDVVASVPEPPAVAAWFGAVMLGVIVAQRWRFPPRPRGRPRFDPAATPGRDLQRLGMIKSFAP